MFGYKKVKIKSNIKTRQYIKKIYPSHCFNILYTIMFDQGWTLFHPCKKCSFYYYNTVQFICFLQHIAKHVHACFRAKSLLIMSYDSVLFLRSATQSRSTFWFFCSTDSSRNLFWTGWNGLLDGGTHYEVQQCTFCHRAQWLHSHPFFVSRHAL